MYPQTANISTTTHSASVIFEAMVQLVKNDKDPQQAALKKHLMQYTSQQFDINRYRILNDIGKSDNKEKQSVTIEVNETLLHKAILFKNIPALNHLINVGANVNIKFIRKEIPLQMRQNGSINNGFPQNIEGLMKDFTPLELACKIENQEIANILLTRGSVIRAGTVNTPLAYHILNHVVASLTHENVCLRTKLQSLSDIDSEKNALIKTYQHYLQTTDAFLEKVIVIQTAIRNIQAIKTYRNNYPTLTREGIKRNEEQFKSILAQLTEKLRFDDIRELSTIIAKRSSAEAYEMMLHLKRSLNLEINCVYYLIIGDDNYSFILSLYEKKQQKEKKQFQFITVDNNDLNQLAHQKVDYLSNRDIIAQYKNITILNAVDVVNLSDDSRLAEVSKSFNRIYFNCLVQERNLPGNIQAFFQEARKLQKAGDKIYILLAKGKQSKKRKGQDIEIHDISDIFEEATNAGYAYHKEKLNVAMSYTSYQPAKLQGALAVCSPHDLEEHVFKRTDYQRVNSVKRLSAPAFFKTKVYHSEKTAKPRGENLDSTRQAATRSVLYTNEIFHNITSRIP